MQSAVPPLIYSPRLVYTRVGFFGRLLSLALSVGCVSLLVVAARLTPSPTGIGTHTALGLQRCDFERRTGLPCPSCGMTTSFAWFVRGNLPASVYVQPMGAVLAALAACVFWVGLYITFTGRPVHRLLTMAPVGFDLPTRVVWILFALTMLAWGWKIAIHLGKVDGWTASTQPALILPTR
jgi:hypothetical protein